MVVQRKERWYKNHNLLLSVIVALVSSLAWCGSTIYNYATEKAELFARNDARLTNLEGDIPVRAALREKFNDSLRLLSVQQEQINAMGNNLRDMKDSMLRIEQIFINEAKRK